MNWWLKTKKRTHGVLCKVADPFGLNKKSLEQDKIIAKINEWAKKEIERKKRGKK